MVDTGYEYKELINNNGTEGNLNPRENNTKPSSPEIQTETLPDEKNPSLEPAQLLREQETNDIIMKNKKVVI